MPKRKSLRWSTNLGVLIIGGCLYTLIEWLWRGHSHWSMFLLGGVCFRVIGGIHQRFAGWKGIWRCGLCSVAITGLEFLCGCVVNLWLGWRVWDYSRMPLNLKGQVCLLYAVLWGLLSLIAAPVYRLTVMWLGYGSRCRRADLPQGTVAAFRGSRHADVSTE